MYVLTLINVKLRHSILPGREKSTDKVDFYQCKVLSLLSCIVEVKKEKSLHHSALLVDKEKRQGIRKVKIMVEMRKMHVQFEQR